MATRKGAILAPLGWVWQSDEMSKVARVR